MWLYIKVLNLTAVSNRLNKGMGGKLHPIVNVDVIIHICLIVYGEANFHQSHIYQITVVWLGDIQKKLPIIEGRTE